MDFRRPEIDGVVVPGVEGATDIGRNQETERWGTMEEARIWGFYVIQL